MLGLTKYNNYRCYWASIPTLQSNWSTYKSSFLHMNYTLNSSYENSCCASTLLNTNNWAELVNAEYADFAIGGPTIEMWINSWNNLYPSDRLYCNNTNSYGYYLGTTSTETSKEISRETMNTKEGFSNKLYYPITEAQCTKIDGSNYYIASPGGYTYPYYSYYNSPERVLLAIWTDGAIGYSIHYNSYGVTSEYPGSLRPIVRLKSETQLIEDDSGICDYRLCK